jgi:hypothetical protein
MKPAIGSCLPLLFLMFCTVSAHSADFEKSLQQSFSWQAKNNVDSALFYLWEARSLGMSPDSFCLFAAKIYLARSVLDTALAMNLAARPAAASPLRSEILTQRFAIYSLLGLKDYASRLLDSLPGQKKSFWKALVPNGSISADGGYGVDVHYLATQYPWQAPVEPGTIEKARSWGYALNGRLGWDLLYHKSIGVTASLVASASQPYGALVSTGVDSADYAAGFALRFAVLDRRLNIDYEWLRKHSSLQHYRSGNRISALLFTSRAKMTNLLSAGYCVDLASAGIIDNQYMFLADNLARALPGGRTFELSSFASILLSKPLNIYFDVMGPSDSVSVTSIPQNQLGLDLLPHLRQKLPAGFSIEAGIGYEIAYWFQPYRWFVMPSMGSFQDPVLLYEESANQYRLLDRFTGALSNPIEIMEKKRLDDRIIGTLAIEKSIGRAGSLSVDGEISKTFSTLGQNGPIDVPNRMWRASARWNCYF